MPAGVTLWLSCTVLLVHLQQLHAIDSSGRVYAAQREKDIADRFWRRTHHKHTLYFWPTGGFGNMMRSLAAMLESCRAHPVNIKVVFDQREGWEFAGGWYDFFRYPDLIIAPFPGNAWHPNHGAKCTMHWNGQGFPEALHDLSSWERTDNDEAVFCMVAGLTTWGIPQRDMLWVYQNMKPSETIQNRIDQFKEQHSWETHRWVGVHIRRRDHATQPFFQEHWKKHNISLDVHFDKNIDGNFKELPYPYWWQLDRWTDAMAAVGSMSPKTRHETRYYISTDESDTLQKVTQAFPAGVVFSADKDLDNNVRGTFQGQVDAFVDLMLLAECKFLIGTASSTFTDTAHYIGNNYLVLIGCTDQLCMDWTGPLDPQAGWHGFHKH